LVDDREESAVAIPFLSGENALPSDVARVGLLDQPLDLLV
jgi:hypothetical protein